MGVEYSWPTFDVTAHGLSVARGRSSNGWPLNGASWEKQTAATSRCGSSRHQLRRRGFVVQASPLHRYNYGTFAADLDVYLVR